MSSLWPKPEMPLTGVPVFAGTVVGIDPSLTSTGVAIIEWGKLSTFRLTTSLKGPARLDYFRGRFSDVLRQFDPAMVVIEGYSYGSKFGLAGSGELGGVLKLALWDAKVAYGIAQPGTLKSFATGKGSADKEQVSKELFKRFGVDVDNNDKVDAAGLAVMAAWIAEPAPVGAVKLTKAQLDSLGKVERFSRATGCKNA